MPCHHNLIRYFQAFHWLAGKVRHAGRPSASQTGLILTGSCHLKLTDPVCLEALCMVSPSSPVLKSVALWVLDARGSQGF